MSPPSAAPRLKKQWLLIAGVFLVGAVHLAYSLSQLPNPVASHFGPGGAPNGWLTKQGLVLFELLLVAILLLAFGGTSLFFRRLPLGMINLPHKDYWFAPERREESAARLSGNLLWSLAWTLGLVIAVNQLLVVAHRAEGGPRLSESTFLWVVGIWVVGLLLLMVQLYRTFPRPPVPMGSRPTR